MLTAHPDLYSSDKMLILPNRVKNEIPEIIKLRSGLQSVRGYCTDHLMIEAETAKGSEIDVVLSQMLENCSVQYIHVHNAGPGCFNCLVERA